MKTNFFLFASMFGLFLLAFESGFNKSTLNQCTNNNSNDACNYLVKHGSSYERKIAKDTLLSRGF